MAFKKKEKKDTPPKSKKAKEKGKQTITPVKGLIGDAVDYRFYKMQRIDVIKGFVIAFVAAFFVMMVFFRNPVFSLIIGAVAGVFFQKPYCEYLKRKRIEHLLDDFRSMLESLTTSYSSGRNTQNAFEDAYNDLRSIYGDEADIVKESKTIVDGLRNNINVEDLLRNFAQRSGLEDIESFADVFEVSFRQGANINSIIGTTRDIINDKISVEMDIRTAVSGGRNELNVMMIMPIIVFIGLSGLGSEMTVVSNTPLNVIVKIIAISVFVAAYFIGKKIVDIKI